MLPAGSRANDLRGSEDEAGVTSGTALDHDAIAILVNGFRPVDGANLATSRCSNVRSPLTHPARTPTARPFRTADRRAVTQSRPLKGEADGETSVRWTDTQPAAGQARTDGATATSAPN
jgi:hypothetical protein